MEELQLSIEYTVNQRALFGTATDTYLFMKRVFDILVAIIGILISLPIFLVIALIIKLMSPGPIFTTQYRNGFKGKVFKLFEFRIGSFSSYKNGAIDIEMTKVGKFMKSMGVHKLPQLVNVLLGDMSIVGPYPPKLDETFAYDAWHKLRLSVKPGLVGLCQTYEKRKTNLDQMVRLDLKYIRERGFINDIKILLKATILTKRKLDFMLSLFGIILLIPFFGIISILIKLSSKDSIIFKHKRIGQDGKQFEVYKFCTMLPNAEELIKQFTPEQKKEFEESFKLKDDPRITRIGKILRETSLDELPQIFNILKGEMSIVGPRPIVTAELDKYGKYAEKLLLVKPGLTGAWQANGRSDTSYDERVQMDMEYIDNINLKLDIKIILETAINVLKRKGAY